MKIANRASLKLLEKHIQQYVVDYLVLDGWRAFKMEANSERGFVLRVQAKISAHPVLTKYFHIIMQLLRSCMRAAGVGEPGMCDYLFIRYDCIPEIIFDHPETDERKHAEVLWIEFKAPGEKPRKEQTIWHEAERDCGALVWVVDSIDGWPERYRASGLQRKAIS